MRYKLIKKSAQAAVEVAVFGTVLVFMLGVLISYGQSLNQTHYMKMLAFRKALAKAFVKCGSVSYTIARSKRNIDLQSLFGKGRRGISSGSASLLWVKGVSTGSHGFYEMDGIYKNNKLEPYVIELPQFKKKITGSNKKVLAPIEIYKTETYSQEDFAPWKRENELEVNAIKIESHNFITNRNTADIKDKIFTKFYARFQPSDKSDTYDYGYEKHLPNQGEITMQYHKKKMRQWITPVEK